MTWIQTFTGKAFDLDHPTPDQIDIRDIVWGLSCQTRYCGQARFPYTIAQHSVHVMELVSKTNPELACLAGLHDSAEAYTGDWTHPLKELFRKYAPWALTLERNLEYHIGNKLGLPLDVKNPIIKKADNVALVTERAWLRGPSDRPWKASWLVEGIERGRHTQPAHPVYPGVPACRLLSAALVDYFPQLEDNWWHEFGGFQ